jgi:hypothetical protein
MRRGSCPSSQLPREPAVSALDRDRRDRISPESCIIRNGNGWTPSSSAIERTTVIGRAPCWLRRAERPLQLLVTIPGQEPTMQALSVPRSLIAAAFGGAIGSRGSGVKSLRRYRMRVARLPPATGMLVFTATATVCACGAGTHGGFLFSDDGGPSDAASTSDDGSGGSTSGSGGNASGGAGLNADDATVQSDGGGASRGGGCPAICGGCCDASGNCEVGTDDTACGLHGAACVDCTLTGQTCQSGVCPSPSASSSGGSSGSLSGGSSGSSSGFRARDGGRYGSSGSSGSSSGFGARDGGRFGGSGSGGSSGFGFGGH